MSQLDGTQYRTLQDALLSAYPERDDLERLVRFELDQNLNAIVGEEDLTGVIYKLIEWYDSHGRVQELINGAKRDNPDNPDLAALTIKLREAPNAAPVSGDVILIAPAPQLSSMSSLPRQQNGLMWVSLALTAAVVALLAVFVFQADLLKGITSGGGGEVTAVATAIIDEPNTDAGGVTSEATTPAPVVIASPETATPTYTPPSTSTSTPTASSIPMPLATDTPVPSSAPTVDEAANVAAIIRQEIAYGNARDLNGILSLWADDAQIVNRGRTEYDPSDDVIYAGIDAIRSFYESYFALNWIEYDVHNPVTTVKGNNAIVVHEGTFSDGILYEDKATFTLKKVGDTWRIVELEVGTTPP